jgi:hypothetical protein
LITPTLVIAEVAYLLESLLGPEAEISFLGDLASGNVIAEPVAAADWLRIAELNLPASAPRHRRRLGGRSRRTPSDLASRNRRPSTLYHRADGAHRGVRVSPLTVRPVSPGGGQVGVETNTRYWRMGSTRPLERPGPSQDADHLTESTISTGYLTKR